MPGVKPGMTEPMTAAAILRLSLTNFRSYRTAQMTLAGPGPVVLTGPNGAGKTNLLEAISFLAPGRGLRGATLDEIAFNESTDSTSDRSIADPSTRSWAVAAEIEGMAGLATLGTGIEASPDSETRSRQCRIDRETVSSSAYFADHLRIIWLVPAMDQIFNGPASDRRRFLDRLVLAVDGQHSSRVNALMRSLRARNRLLEDPHADTHWLDAVEHETAELAVAVAAARAETAGRLTAALAAGADDGAPFPVAESALDGWMEQLFAAHSATGVEDRYRAILRDNRARDAAAGRTLDGPHLTDLAVHHVAKNTNKNTPAADASTGEQKALLIRLVLAHANLIKDMTGTAPVLLLDEVVAHLDPQRRAALYDALSALGAQVWMTGADPAAFAAIADRAQTFEVRDGRLEPRAGAA
jgi:DNA replication and repair protein RecF